MQITVHKPNLEVISQEAKRIRLEGGGSGEIKRFDFKEGKNTIRLLPPWSVKGLLFKKFMTHFSIKPENSIFNCLSTWPDKYDSCFVCESLDKVQALFPDLDLWRQRATVNYHSNVIDRADEDKGVQIARITPGVYNWIMLQMDNPEVGDLSDYESAFDIVVTKTVEKKGNQKRTTYKCDRAVNRTALHEDEDIVASWLTSIYDLDRIVAPPKDEILSEMKGASSRMLTYYQRKHRDGADLGEDSPDSDPAPAPSEPSEVASKSNGSPSGQSVEKSAPADSLEELDPSQYPPCHASLDAPKKNESGTIGFDPSGEDCITCAFEFACMDAKAAKGL